VARKYATEKPTFCESLIGEERIPKIGVRIIVKKPFEISEIILANLYLFIILNSNITLKIMQRKSSYSFPNICNLKSFSSSCVNVLIPFNFKFFEFSKTSRIASGSSSAAIRLTLNFLHLLHW